MKQRFTLLYTDHHGQRRHQFSAPSTELGIAKAVEYLNHRSITRKPQLTDSHGRCVLPGHVRWW